MRRYSRPRRTTRRRRQGVSWLNTPKSPIGGEQLNSDGTGTLEAFPVFPTSNLFVNTSYNARFAKAEDELVLLRILGRLRFGRYVSVGLTELPLVYEWRVSYGLVFVHGEYGPEGDWTADANLPDPRKAEDDPEKWLYKDTCFLTPGWDANLGDVNNFSTYMQRPRCMTNEQQLPNGSWLDIKPKRKLQYEEKLMIVTAVDYQGDEDTNWAIFMNSDLRALIAKTKV